MFSDKANRARIVFKETFLMPWLTKFVTEWKPVIMALIPAVVAFQMRTHYIDPTLFQGILASLAALGLYSNGPTPPAGMEPAYRLTAKK